MNRHAPKSENKGCSICSGEGVQFKSEKGVHFIRFFHSGMINILESSFDLWTDFYHVNEEDVQGIVQADCFGYIFGWVGACLAEYDANGELNVENQYKRMKVGLFSGLGYSSGVSKRWANKKLW